MLSELNYQFKNNDMNKRYICLTVIFIILIFVSCNKWLDPDINIDPDSPQNPTPDLLLSGVEARIGYIIGGFDAAGITGMWMKYIKGSDRQAQKLGQYNIVEKDVDNLWGSLYSNILVDLQLIIEKSKENRKKSPHYEGIAKILMAMTYGTATQLWGDIPMTQALQGKNNITPVYDSQESIYQNIQVLLNEAIELLKLPADSNFYIVKGDMIYKNNISKWIKAAKSLKLRYMLHTSKVKGNTIYSQIINYYSTDTLDFINSKNEDLQVNFGIGYTENNPLYQFDEQRGDCSYSPYFDSVLKSDIRKEVLVSKNDLFAGPYYGDKNSPVCLITMAEVKLILAEAYYYKGIEDSARLCLFNAFKASIEKTTAFLDTVITSMSQLRQAELNKYNNKVSKLTGTNLIEEINKQQYIVLFLNPEAFVQWRRTGYPKFTDADKIPRRYPYSSEERLYNPNRPTNTNLFTRMWIDPQ
jgi:hypothetical protein